MFAIAALTFVACEDDDDDDNNPVVNEEEVITDMILTFTDVDTQQSFEYTFSDPDGEGGNDPVADDIVLGDSATYTLAIEVRDASNPNDVEDITEEIAEEDEEHQFFFIAFDGAENSVDISYDPTDVDENGNPVGLSSFWAVTQPTSSGNEKVRIVLRHEPNKDGADVSDGDITNAGGETDIEWDFNLTVTD
jgi:hypothetical protein